MKHRVTVGILGEDIGLPLLEIAGATRLLLAEDHPAHTHTAWELLVMLWGEMVQEVPGRRLALTGGNLLIIRPGVKHGPPRAQLKPGKFLWVRITAQPATLGGSPFLAKDYRRLLATLDRNAGIVRTIPPALMTELASYWRLLDRFTNRRGPAVSPLLVRMMTCLILVRLAECLEEETTPRDGARVDRIVRAACDYMAEHYTEKILLRQIADHVGYDVSWFAKLFRERLGVTPGSYLQSFRVEKAKELLSARQASLTDIALSTGFPDSQYFSRVFRKFTGHSPSEYRCRSRPSG